VLAGSLQALWWNSRVGRTSKALSQGRHERVSLGGRSTAAPPASRSRSRAVYASRDFSCGTHWKAWPGAGRSPALPAHSRREAVRAAKSPNAAGNNSKSSSAVTWRWAAWSVSGGKTRVGRRGPACHPEGAGEAEPIGVGPGGLGDRVHDPADGVVHAQISIGLLADAVGHLGAQHDARAALVGLELVESGLDLPSLPVAAGQFVRGCGGRVDDRGQQSADRLLAGDRLGARRPPRHGWTSCATAGQPRWLPLPPTACS